MRASALLLPVLLLALEPTRARATSDDGLKPTTSSAAESGVPNDARASVVIIAREDEHPRLSALLDELLRRQGIASDFSRAARFDPDVLFLETADDPRVLVFIVVETRRARLYFRGPGGQRFLLRRLALPSGLDAVGQELIGHIVESATLALLRSTEGLSREQASAELTRASADESEPAEESESAAAAPGKLEKAPDAAPVPLPSHTSAPSPFELAFGARYGALWSGSAFGFSHGPGVELSLAYRLDSVWLVRARVLGARHFTQTLSSSELEAGVQSTPLRGGFDLGMAQGGSHRVLLGVAAGADLVRVTPGPSFSEDIALGSAATRAVPMLRSELRYELLLGSVALALASFIDTSLVETRYELADGQTRRTLGAPLHVRPGAALTLAFGPSVRRGP